MIIRWLALGCVGWLAASAHAETAPTPAIVCAAPVATGASFEMRCTDAHRAAPLTLVMRGTIEDDTAKPTAIEVGAAGKPPQSLTVESDGVPLEALQKESFEAIDLDFDGFDDLKVLTATSAGPNAAYAYWLYRPATGSFERRPDLDDLLSGFEATVDPKTKMISMSARDNCCSWSVDIYRWANDKLAPVSHQDSGALDLGDALADVAGIRAFRDVSPEICATVTRHYDGAGRIIREVFETEGDPCDDPQDYRKTTTGIDKTVNGTQRHGAVTDVYHDGILLQRTILYDPPKQPVRPSPE